MRRAGALFVCAFAASILAQIGGASAKPIEVSFPIVVGASFSAQPSINVRQPESNNKPAPANIVFRQDARVAAAVRVSAFNVETESAGWIGVPQGTVFIAAKTSLGDVFCRAFIQNTKGSKQYQHTGVCLRDADKNGAFEQVLEAPEGKYFSVFDIARLDEPGAIGSINYTAIGPDARPHADIVLRARVKYGMGIGVAGPPLGMVVYSGIAVPDEFLTEYWGARNWPLVSLDGKTLANQAPESNSSSFSAPDEMKLGAFTVNATAQGEIVSLQTSGQVAPGAYELTGHNSLMGISGDEKRRVFKAKLTTPEGSSS